MIHINDSAWRRESTPLLVSVYTISEKYKKILDGLHLLLC